jgi:nucleotide-binding universal stress UspA family protein
VNEYAPIEEKRWRILVAITGTTEGQHALEHAIELAARSDSELLGLVIEERLPAYPATRGEVDDAARRQRPLFDTITRLAIDEAAEHGVEMQISRRPGPLVRALVREASASSVDLVVLGRPPRLKAILFQPRLASLIRRTHCPILIAP